jgi:hypothetical protein
MKKIIVGMGLFLSVISLSAFATGEKDVNPQVLRSFNVEFIHAENVKWTKAEEIYVVNFTQNSFRVEAYFDEAGVLLGTARNLLFNELPLAVASAVNKKYKDAPVYEIFEYTVGNETFYRMKVDLPQKTFQVRCGIGGDLSVEKRIKQ